MPKLQTYTETKIGIYKITNPNGLIYIGQSINLYFRFKRYKELNCKTQIKLFNSLNKYGADNHFFEIIEICKKDELNNKERYWQDYYNVLSKNGLSCKLTNTEDKTGSLSEETKFKIKSTQKINRLFYKNIRNENKIITDIIDNVIF